MFFLLLKKHENELMESKKNLNKADLKSLSGKYTLGQ